MKNILLFLFAIMCGLMSASPAQTADSIDEIVKRALAMKVYFEREVKDLTMVQKVASQTPQGESISYVTTMSSGRLFRLENKSILPKSSGLPGDLREIVTIAVSDGEKPWVISTMGGKRLLSGPAAKQMQIGPFWWLPLLDQGELMGRETVDGRNCYRIDTSKQKLLPVVKLWLDVETLTQVKAEAREANGRAAVIYFSDFHEASPGFEVPYKTETVSEGATTALQEVIELKVNQDLSPDLFDPDKALESLSGGGS